MAVLSPGVPQQLGADELLEVLVPRVVAVAMEARSFLAAGGCRHSLGVLLASSGTGLAVRDVVLEGRPFLPLLNTALASSLRSHMSFFHWTSVEDAFGSEGASAVRGQYVSSGLLLSPGGVTSATFHQERCGHAGFSSPIAAIPFRFDVTSGFWVTLGSPGGAVGHSLSLA